MHNTTTNDSTGDAGTSVLASLRALLPNRKLFLPEALRISELQADRLLQLQGIHDVPVPSEVVSELPRLLVQYDAELATHGASGLTQWCPTRRLWVISINPEEPLTRQRFTLLHEYKHIVDHYHPGLSGRLPRAIYGLEPAEYVAEFFAGCVLMPKRQLKSAYFDGIQRVTDLAELFDVSQRAMHVRLAQLGITKATDEPSDGIGRYRLQRPPAARRRYYRSFSPDYATATSPSEAAQ